MSTTGRSGHGGTQGNGIGRGTAERPPPEPPTRRQGRSLTLSRDLVWPTAIALFLATVVAVNMVFIWVAVSGADEVVPSYVTGER